MTRKREKTSVKFKSGSFYSAKNGCEIGYRSGYEKEVYSLLEQVPEVVKYWGEKVKIPYLFEGRSKTYIPDISILYASGRKAIWEIKPKNQTNLPINKAKWTAAQAYCDHLGVEFLVLTEVGIDKLRKEVRSAKTQPEDDWVEILPEDMEGFLDGMEEE